MTLVHSGTTSDNPVPWVLATPGTKLCGAAYMSRDLSYPYEKFVVAIYCLAGKASLQRRLEDVYMSCSIRLKPEDFEDQDMRSHFEVIMEHLTGDGPVRDTVMAMSDDKAESLAEQIIGLFFRIARAHLA